MSYQVPLDNSEQLFSLQVDLDGVTFSLTFEWINRLNGSVPVDGGTTGAWYLSIDQPDGTPVIDGVRCVVNWPIAARCRPLLGTLLPAGSLQFVDTSGQGLDPGITDLGTRVQLIYFTAAEVAAALA